MHLLVAILLGLAICGECVNAQVEKLAATIKETFGAILIILQSKTQRCRTLQAMERASEWGIKA